MSLVKKKIIQVDQETGEIEPGIAFLIPVRQKLKSEFMLASTDGFLRLADEAGLTGQDFKVLMIYLANLDFENYISISQRAIADRLKMREQHVYRSTQKLVEKGILVKGLKSGKHNTYRLNAFFGWKGRITREYRETFEQHSKLIK